MPANGAVSARDAPTVPGIPGPTGMVTFEFFHNGECEQPPDETFPNIALSGGRADSPSTGPLAAVNYSFRVVYAGDANHAANISECEPFGVAKAKSTVLTTVHHFPDGAPWVDTNPAGSRTFDIATVSGTPGGGPHRHGDVRTVQQRVVRRAADRHLPEHRVGAEWLGGLASHAATGSGQLLLPRHLQRRRQPRRQH